MKVGIIAKKSKEAIELANEIAEFLSRQGVDFIFDEETAKKLGKSGCRIREMNVDYLIVLGGDGTILKTVFYTKGLIPILGINFGTMGFLTEITPKKWKSAIKNLIEGNFKIEERAKIDVFNEKNEKLGEALNEVVITSQTPVEMLAIKIYISGIAIEDLKADGVIVSTPTGSTAYCMSAGGPLIDPNVKALIITPLSPFKGLTNSIVIPNDLEIRIETSGKSPVAVLDGKHIFSIKNFVKIKTSRNKVKFIKTDGNFYEKIKRIKKCRF